ncbi:methylmalonyl Co-A mutase-associated GTPase MeaB [Niveispirillum lacus]|uniref:Methylmalonyl Co-A mutase-associated GTPase MeaB n=1 Tax=Niveispirillum lacus TaxID=1981099 RepID=A0A255Z1H0_9PROT|nr:methylmalonyl Co-A mutase-associated GTPase MeaB [Niveispirillum lacus]OYQ35318.1 methylmalonyl Co-A mutase-associated GTPase MeaB [Niveispirillum lacus]
MPDALPIADLADRVRAGDRRALAQAITLVESTRADHRDQAEALLATLLPFSGQGVRVGITGVPGVGKSTFIEAFGLHVIACGHKVAVLAIDPTSQRTGGSILGDKTRMELLSRETRAFIRPSPAGSTLGGVARRTREAMLLVEAAGFDVVIVETVGVGQSETAVADMVDLFLLLLPPAGGDELQGIKKGIVELADMIVVNKADGDLTNAARHAEAEYRHALALLRPANRNWPVPVLSCSALNKVGIDGIWDRINEYRRLLGHDGSIDRRRADQARAWMWNEIRENLIAAFQGDHAVRTELSALEQATAAGTVTPGAAARRLLGLFRGADR